MLRQRADGFAVQWILGWQLQLLALLLDRIGVSFLGVNDQHLLFRVKWIVIPWKFQS